MARILIVDDEQIILDTVGVLLESRGHEVFCVSKGQDAIDLLRALHKFDLLIADLRMTPIDGIELIKTARKFRPSVKVLVISAYLDRDMIGKIRLLGAVGYVRKPFSVDQVLNAVNDALTG